MLIALLAGGLWAGASPAAVAATGERCEAALAATNDYRNGMAAHAAPLPDGRSVVFLASGPRDRVQKLYRFDAGGGAALMIASAQTLGAGTGGLSVEERARRERARVSASGIADYGLSSDGRSALVVLNGAMSLVDTGTGTVRHLPGAGWIAPAFSPSGRLVAAVRDNDLHVIDPADGTDRALTTGGTDVVTHGLAEFAAEEELDRLDGFWWSPGGDRLVVETADSSGVEQHYIADPSDPSKAPVSFRYPQAGTTNAVVTLAIVGVDGGKPVPVSWDRAAFPYVARVVWPARGALSLVVLNRDETDERVLAVDPATGATRTLLEERDAAWINLTPFAFARGQMTLPRWLEDGSGFLWASERTGQWQLELRRADGSLAHAVTPAGFRFSALHDVDPRTASAVVSGGPDRLSEELYRVPLRGGSPVALTHARGMHTASFGSGHGAFVDAESLADGGDAVVLRDGSGAVVATVPSAAETPAEGVNVAFTTVGKDGFDAAIVRPHGWRAGEKLPVVLSVYAGPGFKTVRASAPLFRAEQCMADHGAFVVSFDGRGTPGRGRDWERATRFDLIDKPLADQVTALEAAAKTVPEMDLSRVAVSGWSFGGYFSAMATIRRPDVFRAGVAGAPPVDFQDYDTAYTERYLGQPAEHPEAYKVSNVLTYAAALSRPLLIVHGLTDDNVYFVNTVKLTQALLRADKPYELLLLPGTHMLPDPMLRTAEEDRVIDFLARTIGVSRSVKRDGGGS